ncbi:rRNA maturation RNase YbeY [Alkaliphilus hydrothermalis]|uniref:Endoribonuclease YbeY n=1 Tax=Alkaliphilus hydrothermalis TaxID=1482730 RepID=A0ABS2NNX6_9FIRM|nr:rRNA maturation RNase YbeY [Alkaliphilus hydrothermalis]MBM7614645.1 putative rRNA maturation factor [Alkaliphilus hydrothermalis]
MNLIIDDRQEVMEVSEELLQLLTKAMEASLKHEGWDPDFEVSLSLVNNEEIQDLNKNYRGKDYATDVLSFPMVDDDFPIGEEKLLGDIVISVEKALEQAEEYGHSFEREMSFLTVHSMFHLMGYDHEDEESEGKMRGKEEAVLKQIGQVRE